MTRTVIYRTVFFASLSLVTFLQTGFAQTPAVSGSDGYAESVRVPQMTSYPAPMSYAAPRSVSEPTWYPYVVARGEDRQIIENTPIELRPYRPMHFYGNTVRRTYYRGTPIPLPADFARGTFTTLRRR